MKEAQEKPHKFDIGEGMQVISDNPDYLNRVILTDGRWPTACGECVISADRVMDNLVDFYSWVDMHRKEIELL